MIFDKETLIPIIAGIASIFFVYLWIRILYSWLTEKKRLKKFGETNGFMFYPKADPIVFKEFMKKYDFLERSDIGEIQHLLIKDLPDYTLISMRIKHDSRGTNESTRKSSSKISYSHRILLHFKNITFPKFIFRNKKIGIWNDILKKNRLVLPGAHRINDLFRFYTDEPSKVIKCLNDKVLDHLANYKSNYIRVLVNGSFFLGDESIYTLNSFKNITRTINTFSTLSEGLISIITKNEGDTNEKTDFDRLISTLSNS